MKSTQRRKHSLAEVLGIVVAGLLVVLLSVTFVVQMSTLIGSDQPANPDPPATYAAGRDACISEEGVYSSEDYQAQERTGQHGTTWYECVTQWATPIFEHPDPSFTTTPGS